jgi:polyferredoxin
MAVVVAVLGFGFAMLGPKTLDPNPVFALRSALRAILGKLPPPQASMGTVMLGMLGVMLLAGWISNKGICGWACQLGLLQDILHQNRLKKAKPPFWLTNSIRVLAFVLLVLGVSSYGFDWIGVVDPFAVFRLALAPLALVFVIAVLAGSMFMYRPWCQLFCPFGLVSWLLEQVSILRPRVDKELCIDCKLCVRACPAHAMADMLAEKKIHADCFACGACLAACPRKGALLWRPSRKQGV